MKILLAIFLISLFTVGCNSWNTPAANKTTTEWISSARKPIVCKKAQGRIEGDNYWTLIDADGRVFASDCTSMTLPDTIKVIK